MKVGILSDSHDNLPALDMAVQVFNLHKVGFVLHAGDYVAPFSIVRLRNLSCEWKGVFGNNDGEKKGLSAISDKRIVEGPLRVALEKRTITVVHHCEGKAARSGKTDIFIYGHTHIPEITRTESGLIINPGECCGWLTGKHTVAIVDLAELSAEIVELKV